MFSKRFCFSFREIFILEETKFIKKEALSIFLIAIVASVGMFGDNSIIFNAKSFTESTKALNSLSDFEGFASTNSVTEAL